MSQKDQINGEGQQKVFIEFSDMCPIHEVNIERVPDFSQKLKSKVSLNAESFTPHNLESKVARAFRKQLAQNPKLDLVESTPDEAKFELPLPPKQSKKAQMAENAVNELLRVEEDGRLTFLKRERIFTEKLQSMRMNEVVNPTFGVQMYEENSRSDTKFSLLKSGLSYVEQPSLSARMDLTTYSKLGLMRN
jgi:hypothetical protein